MTGTSLKSPMSGSLISLAIFAPRRSLTPLPVLAGRGWGWGAADMQSLPTIQWMAVGPPHPWPLPARAARENTGSQQDAPHVLDRRTQMAHEARAGGAV